MELKIKLKLPPMPNFIRYDAPMQPSKKQDGFQPVPENHNAIAVGELTEAQALEYAEELRQAFLDHWKSKQTD